MHSELNTNGPTKGAVTTVGSNSVPASSLQSATRKALKSILLLCDVKLGETDTPSDWLGRMQAVIGEHPEAVMASACAAVSQRSVFAPTAASICSAVLDAYVETGLPLSAHAAVIAKNHNSMRDRPTGILPGLDGRSRFVASFHAMDVMGTKITGCDLNAVIGDVPFAASDDVLAAVVEAKARKHQNGDDREASAVLNRIREATIRISRDRIAPLPAGLKISVVLGQDGRPIFIDSDYVVVSKAFADKAAMACPELVRGDNPSWAIEFFYGVLPMARAGHWQTGTPFDVALFGKGLQEACEAAAMRQMMAVAAKRRQEAAERQKADQEARAAMLVRHHAAVALREAASINASPL